MFECSGKNKYHCCGCGYIYCFNLSMCLCVSQSKNTPIHGVVSLADAYHPISELNRQLLAAAKGILCDDDEHLESEIIVGSLKPIASPIKVANISNRIPGACSHSTARIRNLLACFILVKQKVRTEL